MVAGGTRAFVLTADEEGRLKNSLLKNVPGLVNRQGTLSSIYEQLLYRNVQ